MNPAAAAAWQVRKAFTADVSKGNTLIVADYGQLELRLLAHMAGCESMKEAFRLGGDFHSRTALGMYDDIKAAVRDGARRCRASLRGKLGERTRHVRVDRDTCNARWHRGTAQHQVCGRCGRLTTHHMIDGKVPPSGAAAWQMAVSAEQYFLCLRPAAAAAAAGQVQQLGLLTSRSMPLPREVSLAAPEEMSCLAACFQQASRFCMRL